MHDSFLQKDWQFQAGIGRGLLRDENLMRAGSDRIWPVSSQRGVGLQD